ncbi:MAG: HAD-IA family hydrolase, partial [Thermoplasmatota archaeon]
DLDGVLLNSDSDLSWAYTAIKKTLDHFDIICSKEHVELLYAMNTSKLIEASEQIGVDPTQLWPVRNRYYTTEKIKAMRENIIKPFPDIDQLYHLKEKYELCIVSNSPQHVVDFFIEQNKYTNLFSFGIGRGDTLQDIEQMKPHPYFFSKIKERTMLRSFLYIGDTEIDRQFAQNTGMQFLLIDRHEKQDDGFSSLYELVSFLLLDAHDKK